MENKIKHLELIQAVIGRMANNSFLLKGWSVVLVSAFFALAARDANPSFVYLAYFPALSFWILDGYYLWQEQLFRALYDHVRGLPEDRIDFSMNTSIVKNKKISWCTAIYSDTICIFHLTTTFSIIIVMVVILLT